MKTPAQATSRWSTNAGGAQQAYTDGVTATQIDVMGRAIAAAPVAAQRFAQVVSSGEYQKAVVASGGTANWKAMTEKKAGNYSTGISQGTDKFESAITKILAAESRIVSGLPARVPGNPSANMQRVQGVVMGLHALKGTLKG